MDISILRVEETPASISKNKKKNGTMIRPRSSFATTVVTAFAIWVSRMLPLLSESLSFPLLQQQPICSLPRPFLYRHPATRLLEMKKDLISDDFSQNEATSPARKPRSRKQQRRHPSDKNNHDDNNNNNNNTEDPFLGYAIDSFLRGDYDRPFADDAAAPNPLWGPGKTVEVALRSLRALDEPTPSHGAAVFLRFSLPLSRGERWGDTSTRVANRNPWKEILRGSLTPNMFARRLRASAFAELLDWTRLDVTEGTYSETDDLVGVPNIAFVNVALYFSEEGVEPSLVQFTLRKRAGVWLIDTARLSQKELFMAEADTI